MHTDRWAAVSPRAVARATGGGWAAVNYTRKPLAHLTPAIIDVITSVKHNNCNWGLVNEGNRRMLGV